jgi:hypothetical protein
VLGCGIEVHDTVLVVRFAVGAGLSLARMTMASIIIRYSCELHFLLSMPRTPAPRLWFEILFGRLIALDIAATTASLSQSQSRREDLPGIVILPRPSVRSSSTPSRIEPPL